MAQDTNLFLAVHEDGETTSARQFGSRQFGPRQFGPRQFGPRQFGPRQSAGLYAERRIAGGDRKRVRVYGLKADFVAETRIAVVDKLARRMGE